MKSTRCICVVSALLVAFTLLSACSNMRVRVAILDRNFLSSPEAAENIVNQRAPKMAALIIDEKVIEKSLVPLWPSIESALRRNSESLKSLVSIDSNTSVADDAERSKILDVAKKACKNVLEKIEADRREGLLIAHHARSCPRKTSNEIQARQAEFHRALAKFNEVDSAMSILDSKLIEAATNAVSKELRQSDDVAAGDLRERIQQAEVAIAQPETPSAQKPLLNRQLANLLDEKAKLESNKNDTIVVVSQAVGRAVQSVATTASKNVKEETGFVPASMSILADPNASLVVYAPDRYWRGEYNQAFAHGDGGNTDIAIVMQGPGSFSIKGLRNDTSKITAATFNVLKTSLVVAASVAGAPVPDLKPRTAEGKVSDGVLDQRLAGIGNAGQAEAASREKVREVRKEFASLAEIIVSQDAQITADPRTALTNIKSAFESAKKRLNPSAPSSTPTPGN